MAPLMCHVTLTPTLPPSLSSLSHNSPSLSLILMKCTILRFLFEVHWGESKERGREGGAADKNFVLRLPPAKAARPPGRPPGRPADVKRDSPLIVRCAKIQSGLDISLKGFLLPAGQGGEGRGGRRRAEPREPRRGTQDQRGINIMAG